MPEIVHDEYSITGNRLLEVVHPLSVGIAYLATYIQNLKTLAPPVPKTGLWQQKLTKRSATAEGPRDAL